MRTSVSKLTENGLYSLPFLPQSVKLRGKKVYNKSINPTLQLTGGRKGSFNSLETVKSEG